MGPEFDDYNDGSANGTAGEREDIDNTTYENEEEYEKRYEEEYMNEPDKEQSSSTNDSGFSSNKKTKETEQEQTNEETGEGENKPSKIKSFLKKIFTAENIWSALLAPFMFINAAVRAIIFGDSLTSKQLNMKDVADKRKTAKDIDNKSKKKNGEQQQKDEADPKQETEQETEQKKTRDKATTDRMNSACMRIFGQGIGKLNIAKELDLNMSADEREVNGHKVIKIGNDKIAVVKANIRDLEKKIFSSVFKVDNNIYSKVKMELDVTPPARGKVRMPVEKDMQAYVSAAIKSCMIGCALKRALGEGENPSAAYCDVSLADTKDGSVHICADFDEKNGVMRFYVENEENRYSLGEIPAEALVNGNPDIHLGVFAKQLCEEMYRHGDSKDLRMVMDQAKAVNKRIGRSFENDARENRETDKTEPKTEPGREREPGAEPKSEPKTESKTEEKTAEENESKEARQETSKSEKTKEPEREQRKESKERNKGIFSKARDMMEERGAKKETKKFLEEYSKLSYVSETIANLSPRALEMVTDAAVTGNVKNSTELLSYVVKMPGATQYVYDKAVAFCDPYVNAQHPENYEKEQAYIYKDPVSEKEKMVEKIDLSSLAKACNEETRTSREVEKEEFGISDFAVNEEKLRDTENAVFDPEITGNESEIEEDRETESDEREMDYEETL